MRDTPGPSAGASEACHDSDAERDIAWEPMAERPGPAGYLQVVTRTYRLPDGSEADWDIVVGQDNVSMVAITTDGRVVLARQFRPGPGSVLDELPGGIVDEGEAPIDAAARELLEETGFRGEARVLGYTYLGASFVRKVWVAVVTGCSRVAEPTPGSSEFCQTLTVSLPAFREHLRSGRLTDAGVGYIALDHLGLL